jgi:WD40 repeat protein
LEAKAAAMLDHPGIVPIYEVGEYNGHHFFSMAYVEGSCLADEIQSGPLEPIRAAKLLIEVAESVQHAHDHGVVHRDLKPSNVLLDTQGRTRITDFGLAKQLTESSSITISGQVIGTPSFMPPEQAIGQTDSIGPSSDVYALGAVLYAAIVGRPPFQAASRVDTLRQVIETEPVPPRQLNVSIPRDLETIVLKCLEKSIPRRYGSARQLADELQRFVDGKPIIARPIGRIAKLGRWCYRQPVTASLLAAIGSTLLIATVVSTNYARRESRAVAALEVERVETRKQLSRTLASEANAMRMSGRPGQRFGAIRAIRESMKISGPTRELADIAVAALCLPDLEVGLEWEGFPKGTERVALSPTMDRYARVEGNKTISIRTLPNDQEQYSIPLSGQFADYGGLRFSDDGSFLFEAYQSPFRSRTWLLSGDKPKLVTEQPAKWADSLDGRQIVVANGDNLLIVDSLGEQPDKSMAIGHDLSRSIFECTMGGTTVMVNVDGKSISADTRTGDVRSTVYEGSQLAAWPALHPNDRWGVWTESSSFSGFLFDVENGKRIAPFFSGHRNSGGGVIPSLSRCGHVAFSNSWGGIVRMWETRSGRPLINLPWTDINGWTVVSSDNQMLGPNILGSKVRWMRFASGREFSKLAVSLESSDPVFASGTYSLSPDGRLLAISAKSGLVLCDTLSGIPVGQIAARKHDEDAILGFNSDGSLMTIENHLVVHRNRTVAGDGSWAFSQPQINTNTISPMGAMIQASCSQDGLTLGIPATHFGAMLLRKERESTAESWSVSRIGTGYDIRNVAVSSDGKWMAGALHSADTEKQDLGAVVWETATNKQIVELNCSPLCNVAFSPLGKRLVTHSHITTECSAFNVATWTKSGSTVSRYIGIYSPDESLFAIDAGAGAISLRTGKDWKEFAKLSSPDEHSYKPLAIAPDNSRLFALNIESGEIFVWNLAWIRKGLDELGLAQGWPEISSTSSPEVAIAPLEVSVDPLPIPKTADHEIRSWKGMSAGLDFSPDGQLLAMRKIGGISVKEVETGDERFSIDGLLGPAGRISFSTDGTELMSSSSDTIRIFSASDGEEKQKLGDHGDSLFNATYSPDGERIAAGSFDHKVYVWDAKEGKLLWELNRHQLHVLGVEYSSSGNYLASSSWDGTVKIWDTGNGNLLRTLGPIDAEVTAMAISPSGNLLAAIATNEIILWDPNTGRQLQRLRGHKGMIRCIAFSPDSDWFATGSIDGVIKIWDAATTKELQSFQAHERIVHRIAISRDGKQLASSGWDETTKIWSTTQWANLPKQ